MVKNVFGTSSLFPCMVLFTSIKIQKKFWNNSRKPKMQKPSKNINDSFWSALYSSSLMISMLKTYPSHVLVLFSDVMDSFGSSFSPFFSACMLTASNKYERPKEWELIPEYWRNMCEWVSVSVPLQIMLGVLFIIVQVSSLLGYFGKFDYFVLPQEYSHIL